MTTLYTQTSDTITLGKKLGTGGKGEVYAVVEHPDKVAKNYHFSHLPDDDKQAKLRFMAENTNRDLLGYAAWVEETLHKRKNGRVIGFLMNKIDVSAPIHLLYNPSCRRQAYPDANWTFLLYTAQNIAVEVATLHKHGHVIGDVNQGNVLFNNDSKVTFIDADSFQIQTPDKTHLCPVGVAHFTPPELQGNTHFDEIPRTQNHDNFGLALLIFHLLFCGRHPFSGVPLIDDSGNLLEHDISCFRYAYSPEHQKCGIRPPPTAIPIELVPNDIQKLFLCAFTEMGEVKRPKATQWITALEQLRGVIKTCAKQKLHTYPMHLSHCRWCELESRGLMFFKPMKRKQDIAKWDVYLRIYLYERQLEKLPDYHVPISSQQIQTYFYQSQQEAISTYKPQQKLPFFARMFKVVFYPILWISEKLIHYMQLFVLFVIALNGGAVFLDLWLGELFFPEIYAGIVFYLGIIGSFIWGMKYLTSHRGKNIMANKLILSQAKQAYQIATDELARYEQLVTQYAEQVTLAKSALLSFQGIQLQLKHNQLSRGRAKRTLVHLANRLETELAQINAIEKKIKRSKRLHAPSYYRIARDYVQAQVQIKG